MVSKDVYVCVLLLRVWCRVMFCSMGNHYVTLRRLLCGTWTPNPATLPMLCSYERMNELFVCMHICGLYLKGWFVYSVLERGSVLSVVEVLVAFGVVLHFLVNLI